MVDGSPSKICPQGTYLPQEIINIIAFEYLYPEIWNVPWNLQQDICLLLVEIPSKVTWKDEDGNIHPEWHDRDRPGPFSQCDCIYTTPITHDNVTGYRGQLEWPPSEMTQPFVWGGVLPFRPVSFLPKGLKESNYFCRSAGYFLHNEEESSLLGKEHITIMENFVEQMNWSKVKILNYMRSIECPVLCTIPTIPIDGDVEQEGNPDYMEIRELTEEDVRKRGIGSFEETKKKDQMTLVNILDEIIYNNQQNMGPNGGHPSRIIWHPTINGKGSITFTDKS